MASNASLIVDGAAELQKVESVLYKAEAISPFIKERTLGPDLPEWRDLTTTESSINLHDISIEEKNNDSDLPKTTTISKNQNKLLNVMSTEVVDFTNIIDLNALETSIAMRNVEAECKRSMRKKVQELCELQASIAERIAKQRENDIKEQERWLAEKQKQNELIDAEAERQAQIELQKMETTLENVRLKSQQELQLITFQGVAHYQTKFRAKYETITKALNLLDNETRNGCGDHNRQLQELVKMFEKIIIKVQNGDFSPAELKSAGKLFVALNALEEKLVTDLQQYTARMELEKQEAMQAREAQIKAEAAAAAQERERLQKEQLAERAQKQLQQQQEQQQQQLQQQQQDQQQQQQQRQQEQQIQQQQQQEQQQHQQAQQATEMQTVSSDTADATSSTDQMVHPKRLEFFNSINQLYIAKVERVKPLQTDEACRKYRMNLQKTINLPLNAITAVSEQHLRDKFDKLYNLMCGQAQSTPEGAITINDHPLARDYCILLMAKKFVGQAETAVSSNPKAAFPIASVIVSLWKLVPDFGHIFLAYMFKESPFLVPYFRRKQPGETEEEFLKAIGCHIIDNVFETTELYLKRQSGIIRLYAAIMITNGRKCDGPSHPYGIVEAWRWLTHAIELKPFQDVSATMITEMLQTVGYNMWHTYGRQFQKLLLYIQKYYMPRLNAIDQGGPKTRLEILLATFLRDGQIPVAAGTLPPGFW